MGKDIKYPSGQWQIHEMGSLLCRIYLLTYITAHQLNEIGKYFQKVKKPTKTKQKRTNASKSNRQL